MLVSDLIFESLLVLSKSSLPKLPASFWKFWSRRHFRLVKNYQLPSWINYLIPEETIPEIWLLDDLLFQVIWTSENEKKTLTYKPEGISQLHTLRPGGDSEIDFFDEGKYDFTECYYPSGRLRSRYGNHRAIEVFYDVDNLQPKRVIKMENGKLVEEIY
ncbi:MAG: hypothetical protein ACYCQJ_13770 [Nitrososphaerales archaeon]